MANLRLALFDCDGTLVDSQHTIVACMERAFETFGLDSPGAAKIRRVVGLSLHEAVERLLDDHTRRHAADITEAYVLSFRALRSGGAVNEPLFPGVPEVLREFDKAGWLLGVVTGKSHAGLHATLEGHGLKDHFLTFQTADRAKGKPDPEMVLKAISEAGVETTATVVIGDTTYDMLMAKNAGVRAIGVGWGYHAQSELIQSGADVVISEASELLAAANHLVESGS